MIDALRRFWSKVTPRHLVVFLNTLILVVAEGLYGGLGGYERLYTSLGTCVACEIVLSLWVLGKFPKSLLSPYISGISLSLLIRPVHGLLWPFAVGAFLSIGSKFVLRYKNRHIWNPTNFGICVLLLTSAPMLTKLTHEFGNHLAANLAIWSVGLLIVARAGLLHVTASYAVTFVVLAFLRGTLLPNHNFLTEVAPLTGPMYQLFVFFMITDPPTVVSTRKGRMIVAALIAVVECAMRVGLDYEVAFLAPFAAAPALFSLAIFGPMAKVWELWRLDRRPAPALQPA